MEARQLQEPAVPADKFVPLSDQVFLLPQSPADQSDHQDRPDVVIIFGWGDGRLSQVTKYADGYRVLFPGVKIILVCSPILKAMFESIDNRVRSMRPVIEEAFSPNPEAPTSSKDRPSVLAHVMSQAGGLNFAATLEGYRRAFARPMPHALLVLDSTPGSMSHRPANVVRLADAMAFGMRSQLPWPPGVAEVLCMLVLWAVRGAEAARGLENPVTRSIRINHDEAFATKSARRLYIYSKEDATTAWDVVEEHVAEARARGYRAESVLFEGSGHVAHMRMWPEKYWHLIGKAWGEASVVSAPRPRL